MRGFADQVAKRWREPDAGIWEIRGDGAHHVHSKLMAWLALDRTLRIASTRRTPVRQVASWQAERDAVAAEVMSAGFNPERGSYTRSYGSNDLDAAVLVLPLLDLEPRDSPRVRATIEAVRRELGAGGPLLYRYPPGQDGLPGGRVPLMVEKRRAWLRVGMLGGGRDGLVDHLPLGWVEQLVAEVLEQPGGGWGVGQTAPALARAVQDRPDQREAGPLAREPADHLGAPAGLPEGPLEQVGVADPGPVLAREPEVDRQLVEGGGQAGDRGRVNILVATANSWARRVAWSTAACPGGWSRSSKIAQ
jgi:hypothetical protein